jgi:hypothetical protein
MHHCRAVQSQIGGIAMPDGARRRWQDIASILNRFEHPR